MGRRDACTTKESLVRLLTGCLSLSRTRGVVQPVLGRNCENRAAVACDRGKCKGPKQKTTAPTAMPQGRWCIHARTRSDIRLRRRSRRRVSLRPLEAMRSTGADRHPGKDASQCVKGRNLRLAVGSVACEVLPTRCRDGAAGGSPDATGPARLRPSREVVRPIRCCETAFASFG